MADRPRPSRRGETQRYYPTELKERAIRLVHETIAEQGGQRHGAVSKVSKQLGIGAESVRHWVDQADIDAGTRPGLTTGDRERIRELERENFELRRNLTSRVSTEPRTVQCIGAWNRGWLWTQFNGGLVWSDGRIV
jgi:transposase